MLNSEFPVGHLEKGREQIGIWLMVIEKIQTGQSGWRGNGGSYEHEGDCPSRKEAVLENSNVKERRAGGASGRCWRTARR